MTREEKTRIEEEVEEGTCEFMHVHEAIVEKVERVMPDEQELLDLSEFFKIFGDSTRIKILYVLSQSEMCVCDIATLLQMGQSAISHQLRTLKQMRLVSFRRERPFFTGWQMRIFRRFWLRVWNISASREILKMPTELNRIARKIFAGVDLNRS